MWNDRLWGTLAFFAFILLTSAITMWLRYGAF